MKKIIIGIIILALIAAAVIIGVTRKNRSLDYRVPETVSVVYVSTTGTEVPAVFDNKAGTVTVSLPELAPVTLMQAVSASGARYANADESMVFWDKGGDVTVEYNGAVIYEGTADPDRVIVSEKEVKPAQVVLPESADDTPSVDDSTTTPSSDDKVADNTTSQSDILKRLTAHAWTWQETQMNDDSVTKPNKAGDFVATFGADGRVSIKTDCNAMSGTFTLDDTKITFGPMVSTLMYCEGSKENDFRKQFEGVDHVFFDAEGNLVLLLKFDSGSMLFTR